VPNVHKIRRHAEHPHPHGYAEVNNLTVWRAATQNLDELVEVVDALLAEAGSPDSAT